MSVTSYPTEQSRTITLSPNTQAFTTTEIDRTAIIGKVDLKVIGEFKAAAAMTITKDQILNNVSTFNITYNGTQEFCRISALALEKMNIFRYNRLGYFKVYNVTTLTAITEILPSATGTYSLPLNAVVRVVFFLTYDPNIFGMDFSNIFGCFNAIGLNVLKAEIGTSWNAITNLTLQKGEATPIIHEIHLDGADLETYIKMPKQKVTIYEQSPIKVYAKADWDNNSYEIDAGKIIDSILIMAFDKNGNLSDRILKALKIKIKRQNGQPEYNAVSWEESQYIDMNENQLDSAVVGCTMIDHVLKMGGLDARELKQGDIVLAFQPQTEGYTLNEEIGSFKIVYIAHNVDAGI